MGAKQLGPQPELRSQSLMTKIMLAQEPEIIDHMRTIRMGYQEPVNHVPTAPCRWATLLATTQPTAPTLRC